MAAGFDEGSLYAPAMSKLAPEVPASPAAKDFLNYIRIVLEQEGFTVAVARKGDAIDVTLSDGHVIQLHTADRA
jgi:cell division septal protein FtsQ